MAVFFNNKYEDKPIFVYKKLFQRMTDQFHQSSFETIKGENSKLRTYAIFKKEIGIECYLTNIKNFKLRKQVTKFRLPNHELEIEQG